MFEYFFSFLSGYLIGSVPFALMIGLKYYNTDIRQHGSGSLGGANALRVLGKKAGITIILLDFLKSFLPVAVVLFFGGYNYAVITGVAIVIGHCFPVFANFKGGKAVATAFGYLAGITILAPKQFILLLLFPLLVFYFVVSLTKYVSLGSLISFGVAMFLSFFVQPNPILPLSLTLLWTIIFILHFSNIKKLLRHSESKISW